MTFQFPQAALDDRLAFVGTSGSGKTYAAGELAERLLSSGSRVVVVDPLDVWWGLRLTADGSAPSSFDLPIFGGSHADLPLNEHVGALIGETVATMRESCIVSLGGLPTKSAERRFMLAFLEALYRTAPGEPFHLIFDEADLWAPQKSSEPMLQNLMEQIVRRGRVKGFIPWLITQRPAVLSKDVLSQADGLIAMKLTASQDRDALGAWIEGVGDRATGREMLAALPAMSQGQGIVWIPARGTLVTATFPPKVTYDSSRTPKRGEARRTVDLTPLDLAGLKDRLAAVEAETKANDPKALKAEIARLKGVLAETVPIPTEEALTKAEIVGFRSGWDKGLIEGEERGLAKGVAIGLTRAQNALNALRVPDILTMADVRDRETPGFIDPDREHEARRQNVAHGFERPEPFDPHKTTAPPPAVLVEKSKVISTSGALGLVQAAAQCHPAALTWGQIAALAGRKPRGGHFNSSRKAAVDQGWLVDEGATVRCTPAGLAAAGVEPHTGPLADVWARVLPGPADKMFAAIRGHPGVTVIGLASILQMQPRGGHWNSGMATLKRNNLICDRDDRLYVASDLLEQSRD